MATTDSDHDGPIFPDLARDRIVDGPNQLWVADITYIAIGAGFVYLAAILDAWSRRVVGYRLLPRPPRDPTGSSRDRLSILLERPWRKATPPCDYGCRFALPI